MPPMSKREISPSTFLKPEKLLSPTTIATIILAEEKLMKLKGKMETPPTSPDLVSRLRELFRLKKH
jgi:hypothetical protein